MENGSMCGCTQRTFNHLWWRVALVVSGTFIATFMPAPAMAQEAIAHGALSQNAARPVTAAEQAYGIPLYQWCGLVNDARTQTIPSSDKEVFSAEFEKRAAEWVRLLQQGKVTGIQLDASGQVSIAARQDALARKQFAERLASRSLPLLDRAYTLLLATTAFGQDPRDTTRMRISHEYLSTLDALSDSVIIYKYKAHAVLGTNYYEANDSERAIPHLMHAYSLLPRIPFDRINPFAFVNVYDPLIPLANMLAGRHNGRAQIDSLGEWVLEHVVAPPELVAKDSLYYWRGKMNKDGFQETLNLVAFLGKESPPIAGHVWWNTKAPTTPSPIDSSATIRSLADGKIRVIEFGDNRCGACILNLPKLDKLQQSVSKNVEVWYVTFGFGTWGADSVNRTQEAELLRRFYLEHKKLTIAISAWLGDREPDVNGGTYPEPHPTFRALGLRGRPWILVTDGKGRIRHLSLGYREDHVRRTIGLLEAELAKSS
jgi:hypothetical protein